MTVRSPVRASGDAAEVAAGTELRRQLLAAIGAAAFAALVLFAVATAMNLAAGMLAFTAVFVAATTLGFRAARIEEESA